jgi:hypothetical protein
MADPSDCRDLYFRPARKDFNFGNKKKSHEQGLENTGVGGGKTVTFPLMLALMLARISYFYGFNRVPRGSRIRGQ